jgi:alpha-mannosidase
MKHKPAFTSILLCLIIFPFFLQCKVDRGKDASGSEVEEIIVVCKTHFDIGYTHRVSELVDYYRTEMIDKALDNLEQSKNMPPEQQFTWTGPGWVMDKVTEDWIGQTPERRQRLDKAFRSGRFVTHAMPFTYETDVVSAELLARSYEPSSTLSRKYGLPLSRDAKMTDVPSHSRLLATALSRGGVKFIHMGCNWPSGSVQYPDLFWWEGPDGSRVLAMYSSIYGTCTAFWPRAFGKGEGREQPGSIGINLMPPEDWPHKVWLAIIVTGDNTGPPLAKDLEPMFKEVREKYPNIRIRMGRMEDFAQAIIDSKPNLPVIRAEAPDTWIHGVMCDPGGQKLARALQPLIPATEALNTQLRYWGLPVSDPAAEIVKVLEQCMLYDEHTWGGYTSVEEFGDAFKSLPAGKYGDLEASWEDKTNYILTAGRLTTEILNTNLNALAASVNQSGPRLVVYNPLPWSRSGRIEIPGRPGHFMLTDEIPAGGYKTFPLEPDVSPDPSELLGTSIENNYFKVAFDPLRGVISSFIDKRTGKEWVDTAAEQGLGQYMNERFTLEQTLAYTYNYQQGRALGSFGNPKDKDWPHPGMFKPGMISEKVVAYRAASPSGGNLKITRDGAGETAVLTMPGDTANHLPATELRIRLDKDQAYVDMEIFIKDKARDNWPEADWLCLPFNISDPSFRVGRNLGIMTPDEIIPGANRHMYTTGPGITIAGPDGSGIAVVPLDHPLVSLGEPGCWKFSLDYLPKKPVVYLTLYNNQWNTNFRYWYPGSWSSRVRILTFEKNADDNRALVTPSMEARMPLLVSVADGAGGDLPIEQEGIRTSRTGIAVTAFGTDFDGSGGTLLRVWEQGGAAGKVTVFLPAGCKARRAQPVNLRGEKEGKPMQIRNGKIRFYLGAFAPASFILTDD